MREDCLRWNKKHQQKDNQPAAPSRLLTAYHHLAPPPGRALGLASGNCRNAQFLAQKGYAVDAVDISDVALKKYGKHSPNLNPICADLDTFDIPPSTYQLIVNIRFLNRRLFPYIIEGLKPGGCLIFESFLDTPQPNPHHPTCRDYLLRENERLVVFLKLKIVYYSEIHGRDAHEPYESAALVALKAQ